MSNAVVNLSSNTVDQTLRVIKSTLFPDATDEEAQMILDYCSVRNMNVMLKPIHLVPINVKTDKKDTKGKAIYEKRRVIMPGIGSYRIDASRTKQYAGISEPEFGETVTEMVGSLKMTYPKWCKVTVKRILSNGLVCDFPAIEFWKENYASKGTSYIPDETPNAIWQKRTYAQLAKCAEAQALRKAFPESISSEPTADELEGKNIYIGEEEEHTKHIKSKEIVLTVQSEDVKKQNLEQDCEAFLNDIESSETLEELQQIYNVIKKLNFKDHPGLYKKLIDAKDLKKSKFLLPKNNSVVNDEWTKEFDSATGEISNANISR